MSALTKPACVETHGVEVNNNGERDAGRRSTRTRAEGVQQQLTSRYTEAAEDGASVICYARESF
jgi:hypothetical protein